jgi:hypothetical protein
MGRGVFWRSRREKTISIHERDSTVTLPVVTEVAGRVRETEIVVTSH